LPLKSFARSNGHGRKQVGRQVVARQGNLVVSPSMTVSFEELRQMLLDELERQGKPFGYVFDDISGGFTNTQRYGPQAFKVTPLMVYRVHVDGRPDELVRGVDIAGTPKTVFQKIIGAADDFSIFNGFCGAESGWVPVSAASPSLLLSEVEIEKKSKSNKKGPILPAPEVGKTGGQQ
jgi:predicted Zn-dependent protease